MLDYSEYLVANYNIVVHNQVPRSPETNMPELGACMTIKSKVKKYHHNNSKQQIYFA